PVGPLSNTEARAGVLITFDVNPNEPTSSVTVTVKLGSSNVGVASEVSAPTGNVRHFGFAVTGTTAAGPYTIDVAGTDLAGNLTSTVDVAAFNVRAPFTLPNGTLSASVSNVAL